MELALESKEIGWGGLEEKIRTAKLFMKILRNHEEIVKEDQKGLFNIISELNKAREQRFYDLLEKEGRAVCLMHGTIFPDFGIEQSIIPKENLKIVVLLKSWTTSDGMYDGDKVETSHHKHFETVYCTHCSQVLKGSFTDKADYTYLMTCVKPEAKHFKELYTNGLVDKLCEEYYQMPVVTFDNIESLK